MSRLKVALLGFGAWSVSAFLTFAIPVLVGDASRGGPPVATVSFSEFLAEVEAGRVDRVRVSGRVATYHIRDDGRTRERRTIGPFEDRSQVLALRPSDPALPPPTIELDH